MKNKRYQLWKFTTNGESIISQSNNFKYLENKAENDILDDAIYLYIYDTVENKTLARY